MFKNEFQSFDLTNFSQIRDTKFADNFEYGVNSFKNVMP